MAQCIVPGVDEGVFVRTGTYVPLYSPGWVDFSMRSFFGGRSLSAGPNLVWDYLPGRRKPRGRRSQWNYRTGSYQEPWPF